MYFCIDRNCQAQTRLIKELNELSQHQEHKNVLLSKYSEQITQKFKLDQATQMDQALSAEAQRIQIISVCQEMKYAIDQFQSKILKELDSVYTKRQLQLKQTLSNIKNGNLDKLSSESLNDLFHLSEYGPASLISTFAYETIYYLDQIKTKILQLVRADEQSTTKKLETLFEEPEQTVVPKFTLLKMDWSTTYKHPSIVIKELAARQVPQFDSLTSHSGGGFVLASASLSEIASSCCMFKINRLSPTVNDNRFYFYQDCPIGIGVTHKTIRDQIGYQSIYHMKGKHGAYLITSKGKCWSHLDTDIQAQSNCFKLQEGDVIEVLYNPKMHQVTFRKVQDSTPPFSMKVLERVGGFLHFCALLDNSEIELVQQ